MPRNPDGTYALPLPPVVSGTLIESNWANDTLADIAVAMQDSLSRSGNGNLLAPLHSVDGTAGAPGIAFVNETNTGLYRAGAGDLYLSVLGKPYMRWTNENKAQISRDDGATWLTIGDTGEITTLQGRVTANEAAIVLLENADHEITTGVTWGSNTLTLLRAGYTSLTVDIKEFDEIKSGGKIRHKSSLFTGTTTLIDTTQQTRWTMLNDAGGGTITIQRPTGADPELGEQYCVEGSILITNGGNNPGVYTINNDAGAVSTSKILGAQNTNLNAVMVLTYLIHRQAGNSYQEVYSWCT